MKKLNARANASKPSTEELMKIFTVGHSNLNLQTFIRLLQSADITAIADVRSSPFSRRMPHFNKDEIRFALKSENIKYVFLGKELGGRPSSDQLYNDGIADYEKMALEPSFTEGIDRVIKGSQDHSIALMCSEHNPLDCHRCLLVGRELANRHVQLEHILTNGKISSHQEIENTLLEAVGGSNKDMFSSSAEKLAQAYRERSRNVAYRVERPKIDSPLDHDRYKHAS